MTKFLIQSVFALPNETVLAGIVQEGTITVGMKSKDLGLTTVKSIDSGNKKVSSAATGSSVGLHVTKLKMKNESGLSNRLVEFN